MENNEKINQVVSEEAVSEETMTLQESSEAAKNSKPNKGGKKPPFKNQKKDRDNRFEERVVAINRVSKTVKGGRKLRFAAVVVVGDGRGTVGFGSGKASEVPDAIKKALESAKKNLHHVAIAKGDTFPYEVMGKHSSVEVFMKPAPNGTGIIAGGPVRAVLELAGIKNIYSKVYGARTPINIVRATINGIENINKVKKVSAIRTSSKELAV